MPTNTYTRTCSCLAIKKKSSFVKNDIVATPGEAIRQAMTQETNKIQETTNSGTYRKIKGPVVPGNVNKELWLRQGWTKGDAE